MSRYGEAPVVVDVAGVADVRLVEFMHYLYLPVRMADATGKLRRSARVMLPARLEPLRLLVDIVCDRTPVERYVYVTARRGWATRDNPLNRPGWHCDGFGTDDENYVWWEGDGTRFATGEFPGISTDHERSMQQFEDCIWSAPHGVIRLSTPPERGLYYLSPFVVHATPEIEHPHMRSFVKISTSTQRYNLLGNSHNHLFDYDWPMHERDEVRNDPGYPEADWIDDGA